MIVNEIGGIQSFGSCNNLMSHIAINVKRINIKRIPVGASILHSKIK